MRQKFYSPFFCIAGVFPWRGMSLSPERIEHLARLARVSLGGDESATVRAQLERVLALIDQMRAVDTGGIEPMSHAAAGEAQAGARLRADEATEGDRRAEYQAVAPAVEAGLYLVPKVIE
jgi:aspartyl-tRNA(Asn)/glutamyl-tRNA(Gln) amidotransferase subunit C